MNENNKNLNRLNSSKSSRPESHATYIRRRVGVAALATLAVFGVVNYLKSDSNPVKTGEYIVTEGDNAWNIAQRVQTNTGSNEDIRVTVDEVIKGNNGETDIFPGNRIQIDTRADVDSETPGVQLDEPPKD